MDEIIKEIERLTKHIHEIRDNKKSNSEYTNGYLNGREDGLKSILRFVRKNK